MIGSARWKLNVWNSEFNLKMKGKFEPFVFLLTERVVDISHSLSVDEIEERVTKLREKLMDDFDKIEPTDAKR